MTEKDLEILCSRFLLYLGELEGQEIYDEAAKRTFAADRALVARCQAWLKRSPLARLAEQAE